MRRKKVLFVLKRASMGGSCVSMINLLSLYKEQGIVFDVFLMDHTGAWTDMLKQYANLLPEDTALASVVKDKSMLSGPVQYFYRIAYVLSHRIWGAGKVTRKVYQTAAKKLSGKYDHVIAYQESETTEFVQYIQTPHKIAFMHNDVERFWTSGNKEALQKLYNAFHEIACVSEAAVQSVRRNLQWNEENLHLIRNTLPEGRIRQRSMEPVFPGDEKKKTFLFVSVGRLSAQKAFTRIPYAAQILKEQKNDFDWYIIGDGDEKQLIADEIQRCGVEDCVHLLGTRMNPYAYIRIGDCQVLTSNYEAQPMVANEALILDKPVISTEFSSVREVINDGVNGMIVSQTPEAIAEALSCFVNDAQLRQRLQTGAQIFQYSNAHVIDAINQLLM